MTIEQLRTILAYAEGEPNRDVQVTIQKVKDGDVKTLTSVGIKSFNNYSDAVVLQVEVDSDF